MDDLRNAVFPPAIGSSSMLMNRFPNSFFQQENLIHNEVLPVPIFQQSSSPSFPPSSSVLLQPTASTVVIGKGRVPKKAPGNRNLRHLVQDKVQDYVSAKSKMVKSSIVTDIYFAIEELCRKEGNAPPFVRYNGTGYSKTSESIAREKITSCFRDCLHDRYKSSSKNKVAKRRLANKEKAEIKRKHRLEEQQREFLRREMLPMPPSTVQSPTTVTHEQTHPRQQQHQHHDFSQSNHNSSFLYLNQLQPKISRIGTFSTPLFEFVTTPVDRSFFENIPVPIPDMDCASTCSSSSSSYQSKFMGGTDGL
mmetsp:Transcript_24456/g.51669  ORF Transcript_24456/g.51669 Transcript_24456/m.51669 type:complete len:307 (+) Transcript_24456:149-1069(+)|eukprot:CAMPEP_0168183822 /NCGR_PEP_ID=MMETSP0139_2-20121125/12834_1 /TAXON_ID=44445 /ORGANISM="Pseudo-nitzschia australis, Strain 10249 10 AB" /LENGTH=306 /DNA_ID=CAMNT_0008105249 /DNA_START=107 /DNA_END=1027 /DNA_ORIENTATION=-